MATPYNQLPWGFRRGEENYAYGEYLRKQRELKRATDFADRIAAEEERISLERWQPEPEQQEVKITTKADGTSTIVSTEKYPGVSQDELAQEQLRQGGYGLTYPDEQTGILGTPYEGIGDLTWEDVDYRLARVDQDPGINPPRQGLYPDARAGDRFDPERRGYWGTPWTETGVGMDPQPYAELPGGQTVGEATAAAFPEEESEYSPLIFLDDDTSMMGGVNYGPALAQQHQDVGVSPEGTPIPGVDMGGLQRFEPNIIPDEAYRQAYGEQERVMGMRGLLEEEDIRAAIPPPDIQAIEPQFQMPMVDRAIEQVDRGTANILPPIDFPPVQPGGGGAEAPFVAPQAITPEQGPLGPPMLAGVSPEMELQAALGGGGARYGQALPMQGLLTDEEILAGAQMPYGDPGVTSMERALMEGAEGPPVEADTTDIFAGWTPQEDVLDPVNPNLRPSNRVETDILESQAQGWVDPDTGLKPAPGKIRTRQEIMGEAFPRGAMRDVSGEFNKLVQKVSAKTGISEEDVDTDMILDPNLAKVAESVDTLYQMQKQSAMMALVEGMKKKSKARNLRGVGRRRQGRQMQLLNPTPLQMEG